MADTAQPVALSKHGHAAKVVSFLSWMQIAVPVVFVVATLPGSLYLLVFGAPIVAVPIALGILGFGFAKSLRVGHRAKATGVWALLHVCAYVALALHSATWDASPEDVKFVLLFRLVFWPAAAAHVSVVIILVMPGRASTERFSGTDLYPRLKPSLGLWILAALLILALSGLGVAIAAKT